MFALEPDQTEITADHATGVGQEEVQAKGNVQVRRNDQTLTSDWLSYDQKQDRAQAGDQFTLKQRQDTTICGSALDYYLNQRTGQAKDTTFESENEEGKRVQGSGEEVLFLGNNKYQLNHSALNTCQPGDASWYIKAPKIKLDKEKNVGQAYNAQLVFKGIPILYTPWIDFPLDGGRKSGLLAPSFSFGQDAYIETPYYFNIAPNYDATLTPRYIYSRGLMLGGQFRYLQPKLDGQMSGQVLLDDKKIKKDRYVWSGTHKQTIDNVLPVPIYFGYDVTQVSDDDYFRDFGSRFQVASNVNLNREVWLNSQFNLGPGNAYTSLKYQRYQTLQDEHKTRDKPYARLPELKFGYNQQIMQAKFDLMTEMTRFHASGKQNGNRFVANPSVAWDFNREWGFFRPKFALHYTQYQLDEFKQLKSENKDRTLPIISADTGLFFERPSMMANISHTQTLEPRLYYVYIPSKSQNNLPNFDSSENEFNFTQLFRENRFSGQDRINGANQITTALTTRYIDNENGLERFMLTVGQRFHFSKDEMSLSGAIHDRDKTGSDTLVEVSGDINQNWRMSHFYHFNQALNKSERYSMSLNYHPNPGKLISLRYLYDRDEEIYSGEYGKLSQIDLGVHWPIGQKYSVVARQNYSLADHMSLEQLLGIEYRDNCWALRMVAQRYVTDRNKNKMGFFVQLELGSLGGLGNDPSEILRQAIPGYRRVNGEQKW